MTPNAPESVPRQPNELAALYTASQLEKNSLQMRIDALRASLQAISHGAEHPCFAAAKALSGDDDMLAAFRIAKGLTR